MSDLTRFRDHCRRAADKARGADHTLWTQLADEVDAYLEAKAGPVEDLFGQATVEPDLDATQTAPDCDRDRADHPTLEVPC